MHVPTYGSYNSSWLVSNYYLTDKTQRKFLHYMVIYNDGQESWPRTGISCGL